MGRDGRKGIKRRQGGGNEGGKRSDKEERRGGRKDPIKYINPKKPKQTNHEFQMIKRINEQTKEQLIDHSNTLVIKRNKQNKAHQAKLRGEKKETVKQTMYNNQKTRLNESQTNIQQSKTTKRQNDIGSVEASVNPNLSSKASPNIFFFFFFFFSPLALFRPDLDHRSPAKKLLSIRPSPQGHPSNPTTRFPNKLISFEVAIPFKLQMCNLMLTLHVSDFILHRSSLIIHNLSFITCHDLRRPAPVIIFQHEYGPAGSLGAGAEAVFTNMPQSRTLTLNLKVPEPWLVEPTSAM